MTYKGSFKIDVFDCEVFIHVSDHIKRVADYQFRKHKFPKEEFITTPFSGYFVNFRIASIDQYHLFFDLKDLSVDVVNHEKSHLVDYVLQDRDIKADDEVRAYLDGYISHKLDLFFRKKQLKVKNKR